MYKHFISILALVLSFNVQMGFGQAWLSPGWLGPIEGGMAIGRTLNGASRATTLGRTGINPGMQPQVYPNTTRPSSVGGDVPAGYDASGNPLYWDGVSNTRNHVRGREQTNASRTAGQSGRVMNGWRSGQITWNGEDTDLQAPSELGSDWACIESSGDLDFYEYKDISTAGQSENVAQHCLRWYKPRIFNGQRFRGYWQEYRDIIVERNADGTVRRVIRQFKDYGDIWVNHPVNHLTIY